MAALNGQTITLTSAELVIDKNVTISGPGPNLLAVFGSAQFRIFHVMSGHTVTIGGLTISRGSATGGGVLNDQATLTLDNCTVSDNRGGISVSGTSAGGIFNGGTMTITGSTVSRNVASVAGGIDNFGTLVIRNTTVSNNRSNFFTPPPSGGSAGGIENENVGTLEISSSTISNNWADIFGGGIINDGMMTVTDSTVSGNYAAGMFELAGAGGGIVNGGSHAEIHNSTVSSNFVNGDGGGIYSARPLTITNSTISDNRATQNGGGIFNGGGNATLEIGNTILKAGASGVTIFNNGGTVTSRGYNLSSDNGGGFLTATGDQINTNPMLGPLQYNGGPTFTHELLSGSPAINAGDPNFTPPPLYDQRGPGWDRVFNGRIDIGSLEVQPVTPTPTPTPTATATATPTATATATVAPSPTPTATATVAPSATPTPTSSPTPAAQAINLSTRMRVQTGDNVGIGGFIIPGSIPKHVVVRAIGPSLTQFGVPDALADPVLELHGPGAFVTITNDNWRDDPVQAAQIQAEGLAPSNDLESAIDAILPPGAYTGIVRGNNNTSGVGLIEVYDLNPSAASKLGNISTRAFVSTGDNIVIAGFILGHNSGVDRIVARGIGPSLTAFGVPNALADPTLELRDSNGALLVANNNWQDDPVQAAELMADGLAPTNPLESGLAATLPPGLYTALLAGVNNGTGVGVVEVYDLGL